MVSLEIEHEALLYKVGMLRQRRRMGTFGCVGWDGGRGCGNSVALRRRRVGVTVVELWDLKGYLFRDMARTANNEI